MRGIREGRREGGREGRGATLDRWGIDRQMMRDSCDRSKSISLSPFFRRQEE